MPLTAEQIEKSRAEFEKVTFDARQHKHQNRRNMFFRYDGLYVLPGIEDRWQGWLARQETLCVELPDEYGYDGGKLDLDEVREAIEAAGIAHK